MAEEHLVVAVHQTFNAEGLEYWQVDTQLPDGTVHLHRFPLEALEWRAAEYGMDPEDVDVLLDVVIHERLIPEPATNRDDAAARVGFVTSTTPDALPVSLYRADSTEDARTAYLLRIEEAKASRLEVREGKGKGSLEPIRASFRAFVDPEVVAAKAEFVNAHREYVTGQIKPLETTAVRMPFTNPYERKEA